MNLRPLLLSLLPLFPLSAMAQAGPHEVAVSLGAWDGNELGNGAAIGASYGYAWRSWLSTRAGAFAARSDDFTAGAAHFSGELHPFRAARVSPWVGAGGAVAYTRTSNVNFSGSEIKLTGIYRGGVDVAMSPRFALGAEVSYLNYEVELGSRFGYSVDPVTVSLTGRWRF